MIQLLLDHRGMLTAFEAIAPQVEESPAAVRSVEWATLLQLAGLDASALQSAEPQWNWLASAEVRAAWTGQWPARNQPMRIEAAAHRGRPVAFLAIGPWTKPWRTPEPTTGGEAVFIAAIVVLCLAVVGGGAVLARRNLREGRGDQAGALTLGLTAFAVLWGIWLCQALSRWYLGEMLLVLGIAVAIASWAFYTSLNRLPARSAG